jgi:hypothetical protein
MVKLDRSMSCIESVEMCCAVGVSYVFDVSSVVCVVLFVSSVTVSSCLSRSEGCSS